MNNMPSQQSNKYEKKILIISGGWGKIRKEQEHSLSYGRAVYQELIDAGYNAYLKEFISKEELLKLSYSPDLVVFNTLYGKYGENGIVPAILEFKGISYTGSGVFPSSLAMDKTRCSFFVKNLDLNIPRFLLFNSDHLDDLKKLRINWLNNYKHKTIDIDEKELEYPLIIKPNCSSFSEGISIVQNDNDLRLAIKNASLIDREVIIQEFIEGSILHVPVLRGKALSPIECIPSLVKMNGLPRFSFQSKRKTYVVPARFNDDTITHIKLIAEKIHKQIGCRGLTRCDFIISRMNEVFFLEINTQHSIRLNSMATKSAEASNLSAINLIEQIIDDRWFQ